MKAIVTSLVIGAGVIGCTAEPVPVPVVAKPAPPVIINRTIIRTQDSPPEGVAPGSKAAAVIKEFREQEKAAKDARSYPDASKQQVRDINDTEDEAHSATQNVIDKDGHSTQADQDRAHNAIDALRKAQKAAKAARQTPSE